MLRSLRVLLLVLPVFAIFGLSGCGKGDDTKAANEPLKPMDQDSVPPVKP